MQWVLTKLSKPHVCSRSSVRVKYEEQDQSDKDSTQYPMDKPRQRTEEKEY